MYTESKLTDLRVSQAFFQQFEDDKGVVIHILTVVPPKHVVPLSRAIRFDPIKTF